MGRKVESLTEFYELMIMASERYSKLEEIPVWVDDINLGNLKIEFEIKKPPKKQLKKFVKYYCFEFLLDIEKDLFKDLSDQISTEIKLSEKYANPIGDLAALQMWLFPTLTLETNIKSTISELLYVDDKKIFDAVKNYGPIILKNFGVQCRINEWLADTDVASDRLDKLKNALLEYGLKSPVQDTFLKIGRPEKSLLKKLGNEWVQVMYQTLLRLFQGIKELKKYLGVSRIEENKIDQVINSVGIIFLLNIIIGVKTQGIEKTLSDKEAFKRWEDMIKHRLEEYEPGDKFVFSPISKIIEEDEVLRSEFISFRWEPNEFAREILARLLNVSVHKINDILYRKRKDS